MKLIQPKDCKINIGLRCNNLKCKKEIKQNEWFYHCIENSSNTEIHKGPYNYCHKCGNLKMRLMAKRKAKKEKKAKEEAEAKENKGNTEWTPTDIYDIFNKVNEKINLPNFLNSNNQQPQTLEEKYDLTDNQVKLLYLIPDEMHHHAAIWIKATESDAKLMHEYHEICQDLFLDIDMEKFPHFAVFGCDSIEFEQLPSFQKFAMQRILIVLATHHVSLTYCPQIVHLIGILLNKMDEKCVFALCHAMLNASKRNNNMYFTFNYLQNSIRIQTLLTLIKSNVKLVAIHLEENKIDIKDLISSAMESMFVGYLQEELYLLLIDRFFEKGYKILLRFGVSLIRNCQKQLCQTKNICEFKGELMKYSKSLTPKILNSWTFMVKIWDTSFENLETEQKNNRDNYLNEPNPQRMIRMWPKWDKQKISESRSVIFNTKWMFYQTWSWLPAQCHLGEFSLLFNAQLHGYKLMSLYYYCMNHENLVLFIKTTNGEIFGAFVSTIGHEQHWKNFLSDHKAFIFVLKSNDTSLNKPRKIEYKDAVLSVLPTKESLSVGYKNQNLIFVDEGLRHGFSDECKELNSPSLCSSRQDGQFDIAAIEVWSVEHEYQGTVRKKESIHSLCENHLQKLSKVLFGGRQHRHGEYAAFRG